MMRVTTIYASSAVNTALYYTKYLTQAVGELPGEWLGAQAAGFGLAGEVTTGQLELLLSGRDPVSGTVLGVALVDRPTAAGRPVRAVGGFDATLSAPKSLSVWWALSGDERLAGCHDVAVRAVGEYLERHGATTRIRSNGGRLHPDTEGLTIAAFRQSTSRADDPQLHTHLVVSGKVRTDDGRWLALDARFLKQHQRTLGGLYQSVLRAELTDRFGVAFGEIVNGQAEIAGVPQVLLDRFSKRAAEVDEALAIKLAAFTSRERRDPTTVERAAMTREAAADTRHHKTGRAALDLRARWLGEAAALGITPATLEASIAKAAREQPLAVEPVNPARVIDLLANERSTWHRMDVLRTVTDLALPQPCTGGRAWVGELDRVTGAVLAQCIDLDPVNADTTRRRGDGRSIWLDPSANHITAEAVIRQEEQILSFAIDAQLRDPSPSPTVARCGMDVLQADAAAAVAGVDRLVLVVGPAGTGKTTMLRAAADDLETQGRPVFGAAPTAKAARVLETETGMATDTVAKLLFEWGRPDRGPRQSWNLPRDTTVVVDEAGMLNTANLYALVCLADRNGWRLALIGDGHQLQAVGRGGMFAELCATGRVNPLEVVHRFTEPWEATASLALREGDPRALDAYEAHDRIVPGSIDDHLESIAESWIAEHTAGASLAITTTRNDDVGHINQAVQSRRIDLGEIDPRLSVEIADGKHAHIGDVVATRRNSRRLVTDDGDSVRNRDVWTVTGCTDDGDLTLHRLDGPGTVTLPADYVTEHVTLGYATTEPGNQGTTTDASITLVTSATTGRGLYVGATRGRNDNTLLVVTETPDIAEAREVLNRVLGFDRADLPAVAQRRDLHAQTPPDMPPALTPRCSIPTWVDDLRATTVTQWQSARTAVDDTVARRDRLVNQLQETVQERDRAATNHRPFARAINAAHDAVDHAKTVRDAAQLAVDQSTLFGRRAAKQTLTVADSHLAEATVALDQAVASGSPTATERNRTTLKVRDLSDDLQAFDTFERFNDAPKQQRAAEIQIVALDAWRDWAQGHPITAAQTLDLVEILDTLGSAGRDTDKWKTLAARVRTSAGQRGIDHSDPIRTMAQDTVEIELDL